MANARIRLPSQIKRNEPFEVRTLITHAMESGQRRDEQGAIVPRRILNRFVARFAGAEVFSIELARAIAANPYIAFYMSAAQSGTLDLAWTDDDGTELRESVRVTVT